MRIDSAIITGSFSVNGDTFNDLGAYSTTGSNTFSGSQLIQGDLIVSSSNPGGTAITTNGDVQVNGMQIYITSPDDSTYFITEAYKNACLIDRATSERYLDGYVAYDKVYFKGDCGTYMDYGFTAYPNKSNVYPEQKGTVELWLPTTNTTGSFSVRNWYNSSNNFLVNFLSNGRTLLNNATDNCVNTLQVNGTVYANSFTGSILSTNGVVSGSSQIDITTTTGYSTFSSSNASIDSTQNTRLTNLENKSGSLATTGSNTFIGTQIITGSLFVQNNLVVQGSSSLQNITASAVSIGTNTVLLNTATPSIRFAGISAIDSGSAAGTSGSLYFDSTDNEWIFVHQGNVAVTSSTVITGPETYDSVGNETRLTTNIIPKSTNGFHIIDSCLFDNGTTTCIKNNLIGTGTACFGSTITSAGDIVTPTRIAADTYNGYTGGSTPLTIQTGGAQSVIIGTNNSTRLTFASNGIASFNCQICANGFYASSLQSGVTIDSTTNGDTIIASRGLNAALHGVVRTVGQNGITCMQMISTRNTVDGNLPASVNAIWGLTNSDMVIGTCNTERIRITSAGITCFSNRICTPSITSNGDIQINGTSSGKIVAFSNYSNNNVGLSLYNTAGTEVIYLNGNSGGVGATSFIGTSYSGTCLRLSGFASGNGLKLDYGSASGEITAVNLIANGTTNGFIGIQMVDGSNGDLWFGSSSNRSMTIYRTGNHGFNVNAPCTKVHVDGGYGARFGCGYCFYGGGYAGGGFPYGDIYGNGSSYTYQTANTTATNTSLFGGYAAGYFRGGDGGGYGGGGAGIVAIGGNGGNSESVNSGGGAGLFARGGLNGAGSAIAFAAWFDGGNVVMRCGCMGVGTCSPNARLEVQKTGAQASAIFINQCSSDEATIRFKSTHSAGSDYRVGASILFDSAWEVYNINLSRSIISVSPCGAVQLGNTASSNSQDPYVLTTDPVHKIGYLGGGTAYARLMMQERTGCWISFNNGSGTNYGVIQRDGGAGVTYGSNSDYRLKTNIQNMSSACGLNRVMCLRPVLFDWISECRSGEGFIAHELKEIIPNAVSGEKDAVNEHGHPSYQNVDTRNIVPTLVKAIQEQQCIINTLKTCIGIN